MSRFILLLIILRVVLRRGQKKLFPSFFPRRATSVLPPRRSPTAAASACPAGVHAWPQPQGKIQPPRCLRPFLLPFFLFSSGFLNFPEGRRRVSLTIQSPGEETAPPLGAAGAGCWRGGILGTASLAGVRSRLPPRWLSSPAGGVAQHLYLIPPVLYHSGA